jgi:hypothetical protein
VQTIIQKIKQEAELADRPAANREFGFGFHHQAPWILLKTIPRALAAAMYATGTRSNLW